MSSIRFGKVLDVVNTAIESEQKRRRIERTK